jgi:hypothetical protein
MGQLAGWNSRDEALFRESLSGDAVAKLAPVPDRLARLMAERRPYQGPERRSGFSRAAREVVQQVSGT